MPIPTEYRKIASRYFLGRVLSEGIEDESDFMRDLELANLGLYYKGIEPNIEIPDEHKSFIYKVDISRVKKGQLTGDKLAKAFITINARTPAPWLYRIQSEINNPVTVKIGRNTLLNNACAYVIDYNVALSNGLTGPVALDINYLKDNYGFVPEKLYIYLTYIPAKGFISWRDEDVQPISRPWVKDAKYDYVVTGHAPNSQPFGYHKKGVATQRKVMLCGPTKIVEFRDITSNGVAVNVLRDMANKSAGGVKKQYNTLFNRINSGDIKPDELPNKAKEHITHVITNTMRKMGLVESFSQQVIEQAEVNRWQITAHIPGIGEVTKTVSGEKKTDRAYLKYLLGKFASRYMPRSNIRVWVDKNIDVAKFKWLESEPIQPQSKLPGEIQTNLDVDVLPKPTVDGPDWPARYGSKRDIT